MIISSEEFAEPQFVRQKKISGSSVRSRAIYHIYIRKRKNILTFVLYFFPNKHEKNVKGGLVATQDLPYKQIMTAKAYVMKG